ncbi:uncharacterized protein LOC118434772 [Folsomia candida]|uniref:uncharacterized protein LOC118434772 n=1 Tax=Folsomia candida TaxID=158441 RepID=UPI001604F9D0|nr:uncharacterized protein LOC118434772 [Folsomia candida]
MDLKDKKTSKHVVQPEEICIRLEEQMPSAPASEQPSTSTSQQETQLQQQKRPHPQARNPRLKSQTSESLVSVGDGSVKSSERRRAVEEETAENKRITAIVGGATACIFLAAFILIAVTLKMTPKIDEILPGFPGRGISLPFALSLGWKLYNCYRRY